MPYPEMHTLGKCCRTCPSPKISWVFRLMVVQYWTPALMPTPKLQEQTAHLHEGVTARSTGMCLCVHTHGSCKDTSTENCTHSWALQIWHINTNGLSSNQLLHWGHLRTSEKRQSKKRQRNRASLKSSKQMFKTKF